MATRSRKQHLRWLCLAQALMLSTPVPASSPGTMAPRTVSFIARRDFAAGINPQSLVVGDFNGDGVPDLAVANFGSSSVSVLLGRGDGTFQAALDFDVGNRAWSVAVGDFNGDGVLDLAVAGNPNVAVLLGNGDGTFRLAVNFAAGTIRGS